MILLFDFYLFLDNGKSTQIKGVVIVKIHPHYKGRVNAYTLNEYYGIIMCIMIRNDFYCARWAIINIFSGIYRHPDEYLGKEYSLETFLYLFFTSKFSGLHSEMKPTVQIHVLGSILNNRHLESNLSLILER